MEERIVLSAFVVNTTSDLDRSTGLPIGQESLRQAIEDANATSGPSQIDFAIPASTSPLLDSPVPGFDPTTQTWTIKLASALPTIASQVTIDGFSEGEVGIPFRYPSEAGLAVQSISLLGEPTGGTFELTGVPSNPFVSTGPIAWNATAADVQAAIQAVMTGGATATVTGGPFPNGTMTVTFGGSIARQIEAPMSVFDNSNALTGGDNPGPNIQVVSAGGLVTDPSLIVSTTNTSIARDGNNAHATIIIDGSGTGGATGFVLATSHSTLRGLIISGFGVGVSVPDPSDVGNFIQGNFIGQYPLYQVSQFTGTALPAPENVVLIQQGNTQEGVLLNSNNSMVGGTNPQESNVISGNGLQGVQIQAVGTGNVVEGNQIGLISTSNGRYFQAGNGSEGVLDFGSSNQIGGPTPGSGNLISGNHSHGVRIVGPTATANIVAANFIGLGPGGGYLFGNGNPGNGDAGNGVLIENSAANRIGGSTSNSANTISSNFGAGIEISGATSAGNVIENNFIGTTSDGTAAKGNAQEGVLDFSPQTVIGPGNIISGNLRGIRITGPSATGVLVRDNLIGTDITGTLDLGNAQEGVLIDNAGGNTVTGNASGSQVISGNLIGVAITSSSASLPASSLNLVAGNLIGSDKAGLDPLPNAQAGVLIDSATGNTIGGTSAAARNVISANLVGVHITGGSAASNLVQGNDIGTDITGQAPLANEVDGVVVDGNASGNQIGGSSLAAGNVIAFNPNDGVLVDTGIFNAILTNSIHDNGFKGIELQNGGNHNQPAPVLTSIQSLISGTTILGSVQGTPSTPYTIQFFTNATPGPEGKTFLGQVSVTTDGTGLASFTANLASLNPTQPYITATATSASGDTSEFSTAGTVAPLTVEFSMASYTVSQSAGTATITVVRSSSGIAGSVAYATSDGTAKAGVDYVTASGVLSFAAGETSKTFTVSIINTQQVGGTRFLNLALSNPSSGTTLGFPSKATLTILGFTTSGPTVQSLQLVSSAHGITAVVLSFSEPLDPTRAVNLLNYGYSLRAAGKDQQFGTFDDLLFGIAAATYAAASQSVTLHLATPIRCHSFIQLTINQATDNATVPVGVADVSGNLLDGNYDGHPGGVFVATFAQGPQLSYLDSHGNSVSLRVTGGGSMLLTRRANGDAWQVGLLHVVPGRTALSGQVRRASPGATGITPISSIVGTAGARVLLTDPPFVVGNISLPTRSANGFPKGKTPTAMRRLVSAQPSFRVRLAHVPMRGR
jgi:titin